MWCSLLGRQRWVGLAPRPVPLSWAHSLPPFLCGGPRPGRALRPGRPCVFLQNTGPLLLTLGCGPGDDGPRSGLGWCLTREWLISPFGQHLHGKFPQAATGTLARGHEASITCPRAGDCRPGRLGTRPAEASARGLRTCLRHAWPRHCLHNVSQAGTHGSSTPSHGVGSSPGPE